MYLYFLAKISELLDTVFFVLRKKDRQISFLHMYHHTVMPMISWGATKYYPGGHGTFIGESRRGKVAKRARLLLFFFLFARSFVRHSNGERNDHEHCQVHLPKSANMYCEFRNDWISLSTPFFFFYIFFDVFVFLSSQARLTHSSTSSCTHTTCSPPWVPNTRNTCGGRSTSRTCKW